MIPWYTVCESDTTQKNSTSLMMNTKVSTSFALTVVLLLSVFLSVAVWFVGEEVIDEEHAVQLPPDSGRVRQARAENGDKASPPANTTASDSTVVFEDSSIGLRLTARDNFPAKPFVATVCPLGISPKLHVVVLGAGSAVCQPTTDMKRTLEAYYATQASNAVLVFPYDLKLCQDKKSAAMVSAVCDAYGKAEVGKHAFVDPNDYPGDLAGYSVKTSADMAVSIEMLGSDASRNVADLYRVWVRSDDATAAAPGAAAGRNLFGAVCAQDMKECPDGSGVSRTGPNCEFAACPTAKKAPVSRVKSTNTFRPVLVQ